MGTINSIVSQLKYAHVILSIDAFLFSSPYDPPDLLMIQNLLAFSAVS